MSSRRRRRRQGLTKRFGPDSILIVGNLKVGKTTLFSRLVGRGQQQVSQPGTGVELLVGELSAERFGRIIDAPGVCSLQDRSEDANVIRDLLIHRQVGAALLVLDAKNLRRGLALAFQLAEFELPVVVALTMVDEAVQRGLKIDVERLSEILGVVVIPTVAVEGRGLGQLKRSLSKARPLQMRLEVPESVRTESGSIRSLLAGLPLSAGGMAYELVAGIPGARDELGEHVQPKIAKQIEQIVDRIEVDCARHAGIVLAEAELAQAEAQARLVTKQMSSGRTLLADRLSIWARRPATGIPISLAVLALVFAFVGWVGAILMVDLLEGRLFGELLLPWVDGWVGRIPDQHAWLRELLTGQFGLITVGVVLPLGIVMPVLATFFFAFGLLEDSGYLPRMSLLMDRVLRRIGLNGKGLMPVVMGFSCVTMAVLTTRILDTRKQRIIATLMLVMAFPCAPLLGVMMVLLARLSILATLVLFGLILFQMALVGFVANLLLPGRRQDFVLELPPLRLPRLRNSLEKTGHRLFWFLKEAIPYFIIGTLALYVLEQFGLIDGLRDAARPVLVSFLGLPPESADLFLLSFVRREAGVALLVQQEAAGLYDGVQVVVALLVMTMIIPCVNTLLVMYKERGFWTSSAILVFVMIYSLLVGALANTVFRALGVQF